MSQSSIANPSSLSLPPIWEYFYDGYTAHKGVPKWRSGGLCFKVMGSCDLVLSGTLPHGLLQGRDEEIVDLGGKAPDGRWTLEHASWEFELYARRSRWNRANVLSSPFEIRQSEVLDMAVDCHHKHPKRPRGLRFRLRDSASITTSSRDGEINATLFCFWPYEPTRQTYNTETGRFVSTCSGRIFRDGTDSAIKDREFRDTHDTSTWRMDEIRWLPRGETRIRMNPAPAGSDLGAEPESDLIEDDAAEDWQESEDSQQSNE